MDGTSLVDPPRASASASAHSNWVPSAVPRADEEQLLGQVLDDRYRVEARIGSGGMGVVYKATHVAIDKVVAIKALRPRQAKDRAFATRFAQEARLASRIKHPHVVDIGDYGSTPGGCPYYVMEMLDGISLAQAIDRNGAMPPERAFRIAAQIARGLAAAHAEGVIHRDLKPDNVFLTNNVDGEHVKLLDFGIARGEARVPLTTPGSVVGTPEYMSPEQARGEEVDGRSDLYALGIICFEMLVGRVPFRSDTLADVLAKQVFDAPPTLCQVDGRLERHPHLGLLERMVGRLLSKRPDERPPTALDAAVDFDTALSELRGHVQAAARSRSSTVAIGSWSVGEGEQSRARAFTPAILGEPLNPAPIVETENVRHRPSVIVREGTPVTHIPAAKTPAEPSRTHVPSGPGLVPLLLIGTGAAVAAGLLTVGIVSRLEGTAVPNEVISLEASRAEWPSWPRAVHAPARGSVPTLRRASAGEEAKEAMPAHTAPRSGKAQDRSTSVDAAPPPVQKPKKPPGVADRPSEPGVGLDHLADPFAPK